MLNAKTNQDRSRITLLILALLFTVLSGCASAPSQPPCPTGRLDLEYCPPADALHDDDVERIYQQRAWLSPKELDLDPLKIGKEADIPIKDAVGKIIGSTYEDSLASLAAKIWLIDHAEHSVDAVYYIFKRDLVGYAFLGALCNAVRRGVDVRVMVDAVGSYGINHPELKALENCAIDAGFARNSEGQTTTRKARAQTLVFGALSKIGTHYNRRSHDKLMVVDGAYPDKAWVMTGGRNISLSYYGLKEDGSQDPSAYKDMEILLKAPAGTLQAGSVGQVSEYYASILMANPKNKRLSTGFAYQSQIDRSLHSLQTLRNMPDFQSAYSGTPRYLVTDMHSARVRLAHELGNLTSVDVVASYDSNLEGNPNSIQYIVERLGELESNNRTLKIVSPYLFLPKYKRKDGSVYRDGRVKLQAWLDEHPDNRVEIITNSILTSDNFFTQAIIDMDTAPRMLLSEDLKKKWGSKLEDSELNPDLVASEAWLADVNNPRVKIYQTGRMDSDILGGDVAYGKLHAKFFMTDEWGFIGTTNLDYRSLLYNNEMGFFFASDGLMRELLEEFETLKSQSYLWGSPEWLEMRSAVRDLGDSRSRWAKKQRTTFTRLRTTGLHWLF